MPSVPIPRRPVDPGDRVRRWYEHELGWPTVPGTPLHLSVGARFDVLDVPAEAGLAGLRHLVPGSPVAVQGDRMRLLVAPGSADELPGVLDWLEWGGLPLDLRVIGGDIGSGVMEAPVPPGDAAAGCAAEGGSLQGAAVWLRPPEPGCEVEASLPTLSAMGGVGGAPDLVRLVDTVATHCHRIRLRRVCAQALAFS
ncbi:SCO3374 family protein [Streptomyces sp. TRM72054]|uniref:SCO3374 family protein n=1 Tax=Streptomyces sp. TRM72054 TaxID=2870562 RepID=UPI001C8B2283|nr:SCO3374 family protein [Streptomyces sp. TRM72054]MBX9397757.1 SCO3374 family protein [Streptomyces sp. TRM72054]